MAEAARKKPITRHPLFPTTVALWFGALFGLGSMAIKPSLIEQAVLSVGLPAVIPAAEPPLGATMQLLLALGMAGLGGLLGALLARRLGRPKVQKKQRRRDPTAALTSSGEAAGQTWNAGEHVGSITAARRRQLAIEEGTNSIEHQDRAPLPGSARQFLDVTEFDLEGFESEEPDTIQEFVSDGDDYTSGSGHEAFGQPAFEEAGIPADANIFGEASGQAASEIAGLDTETEPEPEPASESEFETPVQKFCEIAGHDGEAEAASDFDLLQESLANDAFAEELSNSPAESPESFDIGDEHVIQAKVDGVEGRAFDPVGDGRHTDDGEAFQPEPAAAVEDVAEDVGEVQVAVHLDLADTGHDVEEPASGIADSRIMTASLDQLSHAELLERLALTLERSRGRSSNAGPDLAGEQPEVRASEFEVTANIAVPEQEQLQPAAIGEAVAEAAATVAPDELSSEQVSQPPVPVIPAALRPIVFEEEGDADQLPSVVPPRQFSMTYRTASPARASEADEVTEEAVAEGGQDSFEPAGDAASGEETIGVADDPGQESEAVSVEQELEEGYSSLLSLSRSDRQKFVRIEEPEFDEGEVTPFVVFPGDNSAGLGPFARPVAASETQTESEAEAAMPELSEGDERRFDQPGESGTPLGQANDIAPDHDPEETERSLKAALATLQRMSGAA